MKKSFYLVIDAKGNPRCVKSYVRANFTETVFRVSVNMPEPRVVAGDIELTLEEHTAFVDGVEMIPLKYVETEKKK